MNEKKKILITMVEAGAGHKMPALAIRDAIEMLYPGRFTIDVVDFMKVSGALGDDTTMKNVWDYALARPLLARIVYHAMEIIRVNTRTLVSIMLAQAKKKCREYIKNYNPDILVATQFFCVPLISMARDALHLPVKTVGFVTDPFCGYSLWADRGADHLIISSERGRQMLIKRKIRPERITILPFPVNCKFFNITRSKDEISKEYSINPSYKTILATAGGQGISNMGNFVKKIYKKSLPFNVITVCGKNEKLKRELEELKQKVKSITNLIPVGFVTNMNELLSISDLNVAKAGASTTFEALFMQNPIIFTHYAAPPEKPNIDFCLENKVGWYAPGEKEFFRVIDKILNTGILEEYKNNLKSLSLHSGSDDIAEFIVKLL